MKVSAWQNKNFRRPFRWPSVDNRNVSCIPAFKSKIFVSFLNLFFMFAIPFSLSLFNFSFFFFVIFKHCIDVIIWWWYWCRWLLLQSRSRISTWEARLIFYSAPFSCLKIKASCRSSNILRPENLQQSRVVVHWENKQHFLLPCVLFFEQLFENYSILIWDYLLCHPNLQEAHFFLQFYQLFCLCQGSTNHLNDSSMTVRSYL